MNLPAAHIERIKDLGYTDSEAHFLYIVAVFSGCFTLGHFRAFTGSAYGKRPTSFAEKLLKQGHATVRDYMGEVPSTISFPGPFMVKSRKTTSATEKSTHLISCAPGCSS